MNYIEFCIVFWKNYDLGKKFRNRRSRQISTLINRQTNKVSSAANKQALWFYHGTSNSVPSQVFSSPHKVWPEKYLVGPIWSITFLKWGEAMCIRGEYWFTCPLPSHPTLHQSSQLVFRISVCWGCKILDQYWLKWMHIAQSQMERCFQLSRRTSQSDP